MGPRTPDWSEDGSLTLNVWAPESALRQGERLSVLVWFHGGGFMSGSGGWDWYDGARLARAGRMVVVTANYRVGPLGYLHLPHIGADNLGIQDQAAVLRWVRDNIASFAGNPEAVTVGGHSAGAYSALSLAVDASTGNLVDRVLLQSGPWGLPPQDPQDAAELTEEYLWLLGVPAGAEPGQALRSLTVERLLSAYGELAFCHARPGSITPPMYPVLGGFGMVRPWMDALEDGALMGKGLMVGTTQDELTAFFNFDPRIQSLTYEKGVALLAGRLGSEAPRAYARYAARFPGASPSQVVTGLSTDASFRQGALRIADRHAAAGNATYVYQFDYRPPVDPHGLGATHTADLPFLFNNFESYHENPMVGHRPEAEQALGKIFSGAVARFVTSGSPSDWVPYSAGDASAIRHFG